LEAEGEIVEAHRGITEDVREMKTKKWSGENSGGAENSERGIIEEDVAAHEWKGENYKTKESEIDE
jgi:hypothetical protein